MIYSSRYFLISAIGFSSFIVGQSALASQPPCNKRLFEQAALMCAGDGKCIAKTYFQVDFNIKAFMQCKADQWNQVTGDNKTVDELFSPKNINTGPPSSSKGLTIDGKRGESPESKFDAASSSRSAAATNYNEELRKYNEEMKIYKEDMKKYNEALKVTEEIAANPERAVEIYSNAIALDSQDFKAYLRRGLAKENLGDYAGAIVDHGKAISINPQYAPSYYSRGTAKQKLEDYEGAISDYDKAIEYNPYHHFAYSNRAIAIWEARGDASSSCNDIKKSASLGFQYRIDYLASEDGAWCRDRQ